MKVIISMSGLSSRFSNAGYTIPKFMIDIDGKKVIEHIIDLYPKDSDFLFIVNPHQLLSAVAIGEYPFWWSVVVLAVPSDFIKPGRNCPAIILSFIF